MKKSFSFFLMYVGFFIYSLSSILTKTASFQEFLSWKYIFCFAGIVAVLGIYAILWQQVLKNIPLSVAMSQKPVALILGLFWALIIFKEPISLKTGIGIILVLFGLVIIGVQNAGK